MDDERIRQLTQDVLSQIRSPQGASPGELRSLEQRVAALESVVSRLARAGAPAPAPALTVLRETPVAFVGAPAHPALQIVAAPGCLDDRCVLEPDKPCTKSHACRVLGH